jgi:hypothetical protein
MKSQPGTDRESTAYDNGSMVYEPASPEISKFSLPESTKISFASTSNLDPAILDPEMSNYFLGTHSHDPPPYSELDADDFLDHSMLDHGDTGWSSHFDDAYDSSFIAQPLSAAGVIDPKLFSPQLAGGHELPVIFSGSATPTQSEQLSVGIAPILLSKTPSVEVARETVKVVEKSLKAVEKPPTERVSGKEKEVTEEIHVKPWEPPKRKSLPLDVSPKKPPPATAKRRGRPPKSLSAQPPLPPPSHEPPPHRLPPPARPEADDPSEINETTNKRRYEVIVATGLDTVKRIKLVFHEDLTPPARPSDPPTDLLTPRTVRTGKRDIILRPRRTPLLAMLDDGLSSDYDDSSSPPPEVKRRKFISGVVVPWKRIDRSLYGVFLSNRARQTMVTSKRDGTFKGIKFEW